MSVAPLSTSSTSSAYRVPGSSSATVTLSSHPKRTPIDVKITETASLKLRNSIVKLEDFRVSRDEISCDMHRILGGDVPDMIRAIGEVHEKMGLKKCVPLSLRLSTEENRLMQKIFADLALYNKLCLMEVMGFSIFRDIGNLQKYFKDRAEEISEQYSFDFTLAYTSMCTEARHKQDKEVYPFLQMAEKGGRAGVYALISRREFSLRLKDTLSKIQNYIGKTKFKITSISSAYKVLEKKITLFCKYVEHSEALQFLVNNNLSILTDNFPGVELLNNPSADKTVRDLACLVDFISLGFKSGAKRELINTQVEAFDNFQIHLKTLSTAKNKMACIKKIKKSMAEYSTKLHGEFVKLQGGYTAAMSMADDPTHWDLSVREASKALGPDAEASLGTKFGALTVQQFANKLAALCSSNGLYRAFVEDVLNILDYQVMPSISPSYIPTSICFSRLHFLMEKFFCCSRTEEPAFIAPAHLSSSQVDRLKYVLNEIDYHFIELQYIVLTTYGETQMQKFQSEWIELEEKGYSVFYNDARVVFLDNHAKLFSIIEDMYPKIDRLRLRHLELIEIFLREFDKSSLASSKNAWITYFQEVCFQSSLRFCSYMLVAKHAKMLQELHAEVSKESSEMDLLDPSMFFYMTLQGIEELVNKLLPSSAKGVMAPGGCTSGGEGERKEVVDATPFSGHAPVEEAGDGPTPSLLSVEAAVLKDKQEGKDALAVSSAEAFIKTQPRPVTLRSSKPSLKPTVVDNPSQGKGRTSHAPVAPVKGIDAVPFEIRYGEKVRVILSKLRRLGYLFSSIKGSHIQMQKGDIKLTVPRHGNDDHLTPGTARAIVSSVNGISSSRKKY